MEFKAYIIPSVNVWGDLTNIILRTETMAHMAASGSDSNEGYLLKGERKWVKGEGFLGRLFGKVNYFNKSGFYKDLKENFPWDATITEEEVEAFAKKKGLEAEKLIFTD